jgi:hypothetical protein
MLQYVQALWEQPTVARIIKLSASLGGRKTGPGSSSKNISSPCKFYLNKTHKNARAKTAPVFTRKTPAEIAAAAGELLCPA